MQERGVRMQERGVRMQERGVRMQERGVRMQERNRSKGDEIGVGAYPTNRRSPTRPNHPSRVATLRGRKKPTSKIGPETP
jgi:hypothetical protein